METINLTIIIAAAMTAGIVTVIFIWLIGEIEFRLWWRKWKRFIDKQYDDAKTGPKDYL